MFWRWKYAQIYMSRDFRPKAYYVPDACLFWPTKNCTNVKLDPAIYCQVQDRYLSLMYIKLCYFELSVHLNQCNPILESK